MKTSTKLRIVEKLLNDLDYLLVVHEETEETHEGSAIIHTDSIEHLGGILGAAMDNRKDFLSVVWDAARRHFSRYIIDQNEFIKEITK